MDRQDIETYKAQFIDLMKSTGRDGVDDLIDMLDEGKMHFFTAPASVNHHLNSDGGLLVHSLNTCKAGLKLREMVIAMRPELESHLSRESVIIATLLHDICKADIYFPAIKKQRGTDGIWREVESYDINYSNFPRSDRNLPVPLHGQSERIIHEIYDDELLAIRWHMTAWDLPMQSLELTRCLNVARDEHPLCSLVNLADGIAANLLEWENE